MALRPKRRSRHRRAAATTSLSSDLAYHGQMKCSGLVVAAIAALAAASNVSAGEPFEALGQKWTAPTAADWKTTPEGVLELLVPRPSTQPRRPSQYLLADSAPYSKLEVELEMKAEPASLRKRHNSLILVYAWRDANHFNYAHLSVDTAKQATVHNGIFHVYGGDRVRISSEDGPATLRDETWHKVRLKWDGSTGRVDVWVDGETSPSMRAVDMSLDAGQFGIGSFFDMGSFRNLRIRGVSRTTVSQKTR